MFSDFTYQSNNLGPGEGLDIDLSVSDASEASGASRSKRACKVFAYIEEQIRGWLRVPEGEDVHQVSQVNVHKTDVTPVNAVSTLRR